MIVNDLDFEVENYDLDKKLSTFQNYASDHFHLSLDTLQAYYSYQSDNNSSADDTDEADLRGFCFACGKVFFGHELHEFSRI